MATGDRNDIVNRLWAVLPPWFPDLSTAPILNAILTGIADGFAFVYSYLQFAALQTRIKSATGGWLDLIAWDYFGANFARRKGEVDASFQPRLLKEILRPRATRAAITEALVDLTGVVPLIFEPFDTNDCGAYGIGKIGYGLAGCYGSLALPNQIFITAVRPTGVGIPVIGGYGVGGVLGYGVAGEYVDQSQITGQITDDDIYHTIAQTVAAGITPWTAIVDALPVVVNKLEVSWDESDTLDSGTITLDEF